MYLLATVEWRRMPGALGEGVSRPGAVAEAERAVEGLLIQAVGHVLGSALHRLQRARSGESPMTGESWLALASVLEGQAQSIREWCARGDR